MVRLSKAIPESILSYLKVILGLILINRTRILWTRGVITKGRPVRGLLILDGVCISCCKTERIVVSGTHKSREMAAVPNPRRDSPAI